MGANIGWSHGTNNEYRVIANTLNTASPEALRTFVYALRAGVDFAGAHRLAFPELMPGTYQAVADRWYSDKSFWFGDSVLTPGQIHEVACETRARLAECLLAGARRVYIAISCAFEQMSATLAWPGCTRADAEMLGDAELWTPSAVAGQDVYLLLRTPFNSGYRGAPGAPPVQAGVGGALGWDEGEAAAQLKLLADEVTAELSDLGFDKPDQWRNDPAADEARRTILRRIRQDEVGRLMNITMSSTRDLPLFTDTVLGCIGGGERPGRGELVSTFTDGFVTPPPLAPGIQAVVGDGYKANNIDMPWRSSPAVTISWGTPVQAPIPERRW